MTKQLRIGIIGLGIGEEHLRTFQSLPECMVTTICDLSEQRLVAAKERYGVAKATRSADEVLSDPAIDLVCIASYDNFHGPQIVAALEKGKHVFAEKPLCLTRAEAVTIRSTLQQNPRLKLSSNLVMRKFPRLMKLRTLITAGEFGRIYAYEAAYNYGRLHKLTDGWRGDLDFYSVVLGGGIHVVDLLLWLSCGRVREVSAFGNRCCTVGTKFRFNDFVCALFEFDDGAIAKLSCNFGCVYPHSHPLAIYGTGATFTQDCEAARIYRAAESGVISQPMLEEHWAPKGALIPAFVESIIHGSPLEVAVDDIFAALSVCFAIDEAVAVGNRVVVDYL